MLVNASDDARAGLDHSSQQMFFPDDVRVVRQVGRRRHGVLQRREVRESTDALQLVPVLEPLLDRHQINRLFVIVHLHEQVVDVPVAQIVKHFRTRLEFLDANAHALVGRQ